MADELHTLTASCWCEPVSALDGHINEDGSRPGPPDLDDTSRCPLGPHCATCGAEDDLAVGTAVTRLGVFCITLCGSCAEKGDTPSIGYPAAAMQVLDHCGHLEIDLEEMAAAIAVERAEAVAR